MKKEADKVERTQTTRLTGGAKEEEEVSSRSSGSSSSSHSHAGFIPKHGGYEQLKSYQKALIVYRGTVRFAERWVSKGSRTRDQMVQAARSGKQNILEGSLASATSKQSEIHLTNVARASLGELKEDYEDFLRDRGLPKWDRTHRYARRVTELSRTPDECYETFRKGIEHDNPEIAANVLRHLTMQATLLLDRQIARLEQDFLREGGIRERMTRARLEARRREEEWGERT